MIMLRLFLWSLLTITSGYENKIELDRCSVDTACFVRESCKLSKNDAVLAVFTEGGLKDNTCDVIMQIKPFNESKFHVMIEIKSSSESITDDGVAFVQGTEQFRCNKKMKTATSSVFDAVNFGFDQIYEDKRIFCSFTIRSKNGGAISSLFKENYQIPAIVFNAGGEQKIAYAEGSNEIWNPVLSKIQCNPDDIESQLSEDSTHVFEVVDTTHKSISCPPPSIMRLTRANGTVVFPSDLRCFSKRFSYEQSNTTVSVTPGERFSVNCARPFCSMCSPITGLTCDGCTDPTPGRAGSCVTSTCTDDSWRKADGKLIKGKMECTKNSQKTLNERVTWVLKNGANSEAIEKAACFIPADCWAKSNITARCPSSVHCGDLIKTANNNQLSCRAGHKLKYSLAGDAQEATKIVCNPGTGGYVADGKQEVFPQSEVYCEKLPEADSAPSTGSASSLPLIAGVAVGLLLIAGAVVLFYCLKIRKRRAALKKKKADTETSRNTAWDAGDTDSKSTTKSQLNLPLNVPMRTLVRRAPPVKRFWGKRERDRRHVEIDRALTMKWDEGSFSREIAPRFPLLSPEDQRAIMYSLLNFNTYGCVKKDDEDMQQVGSLKQFLLLLMECQKAMMDCVATWDMLWRQFKLFHEMMDAELRGQLRYWAIEFAKPIMDEFGWKMQPGEHAKDTELRFFALRVMAWAEDPLTMAELKKQCELPLADLDPSVRPVVIQYAVRYLKRGGALKADKWKQNVTHDPRDPATDQFGTMRQHMLWGICCARDEEAKGTEMEFRLMRDTLQALYDFEPAATFTPLDHLWAYRGATEYVSNMPAAINAFAKFSPHELDEPMDAQMKKNCSDPSKMHATRQEWMRNFNQVCSVVGECCATPASYEKFKDGTVGYFCFCGDLKEPLDIDRLEAHAVNMEKLNKDEKKLKYLEEAISKLQF